MASFGDLEAKGATVLQQSTPSKREEQILEDLGLFGVHMAVIGLGVETLATSPRQIGKNLMIFGVALGVAGYGVRWLS